MSVRRAATLVLAVLVLASGCASAGSGSTQGRGSAATSPPAPPAASAPRSAPTPVELRSPIVLRGHRDGITHLAWSPDGRLLASVGGWFGSKDPTIRLWRRDGTLVAVLRGHRCGIIGIAWAPDGRTLASGSCDGTAREWRADGMLLRVIEPRAGAVLAVAWSAAGKLLATGSVAGPTRNSVQLWDAATGARLAVLATRYSGGKFYNLGWSRDGRFLVGGAVDYREWRTNGTMVFQHPGCPGCTPAWGFAWAPDGRMWAIGDESGYVVVYRTDGSVVAQMRNPYGNVDVMAWSPDGRILAAANALWRLESGGAVTHGVLVANTVANQRIVALAWSPASTVIAATFAGATEVYLRDADGRPLATLVGHTGQVPALAWSPDGKVLASGSDDRLIRLWALGDRVGRPAGGAGS